MRSWEIEALARETMRPGDTREASLVLGRAFAENPVARACLSHLDRSTRLERVTRLNRGLVGATLRAGGDLEVTRHASPGGSARIAGVQLSFAPGRWPLGPRAYRSMAVGALSTGLRGTWRYALWDHHVHPHHPREPHFYLFVLGVDPDLQGRGVGGALLRRFCARADAARTLAYLETDKPESVRIYEGHGFEVARELEIPPLSAGNGPLRTWTMRRPPRE